MIGQEIWKNLKNLVDIDRALNEIISNKVKTLELIDKDKTQIPKLELEIKNFEQKIHDQKKDLDLAELNAKALKENENQKRSILDKLSNSKEYKALEKELKSIEMQLLEEEGNLETKWIELENKKNEFELLKNKNDEKIKQLKEGLIVQEEELKQKDQKVLELHQKRVLALKDIPTEWITKYERMIVRVPNPIVPVISNSCSACYYTVLRQDMAKLKQSGILLCKNCYRFLYYDIQEETELKKESF
jgi:predicted  nucleic acid-binding Zn-ribbon protein